MENYMNVKGVAFLHVDNFGKTKKSWSLQVNNAEVAGNLWFDADHLWFEVEPNIHY